MITVVGGNKGGSGKTTIASNLAIALANKGREVCPLNGDLQRTAAKHHACLLYTSDAADDTPC